MPLKKFYVFGFASLAVLCFGIQAKQAHAAIARLGMDTAAGGCGTGLQDNLATSTTAGELIVISYNSGADGSVPVTISDSAGDTWTKINESIQALDTHNRIGYAYLQNAPAGVTWVAITGAADDGTCVMIEAHYSGIATSGALDQATSSYTGIGQPSPWASGQVTTMQAQELLIGTSYDANFNSFNSAPNMTGNWTATSTQLDTDGNALIFGQQIVSSIVIVSSTGTDAASTTIYAFPAIATFRAASAGGSTSPPIEYWLNGIIHLIGNFIFH
jgi:hypothetical protein